MVTVAAVTVRRLHECWKQRLRLNVIIGICPTKKSERNKCNTLQSREVRQTAAQKCLELLHSPNLCGKESAGYLDQVSAEVTFHKGALSDLNKYTREKC